MWCGDRQCRGEVQSGGRNDLPQWWCRWSLAPRLLLAAGGEGDMLLSTGDHPATLLAIGQRPLDWLPRYMILLK